MSILDEAAKIQIKEEAIAKISETTINAPKEAIEAVDLLFNDPQTKEMIKFFSLSMADIMDEKTMAKIKFIKKWALKQGPDAMSVIWETDIKLGNPPNLNKLDKIYCHAQMLEQEKRLELQKQQLQAERQRLYGNSNPL